MWTTKGIAEGLGMGPEKALHNAINYLVRTGELRRLGRGCFAR